MTDPRKLSINDFSYFLPPEKIANHPLEDRDASRLLIYKKGKIEQSSFKKIADYLPERSLLIFNNTKVIEARLVFQKRGALVTRTHGSSKTQNVEDALAHPQGGEPLACAALE